MAIAKIGQVRLYIEMRSYDLKIFDRKRDWLNILSRDWEFFCKICKKYNKFYLQHINIIDILIDMIFGKRKYYNDKIKKTYWRKHDDLLCLKQAFSKNKNAKLHAEFSIKVRSLHNKSLTKLHNYYVTHSYS